MVDTHRQNVHRPPGDLSKPLRAAGSHATPIAPEAIGRRHRSYGRAQRSWTREKALVRRSAMVPPFRVPEALVPSKSQWRQGCQHDSAALPRPGQGGASAAARWGTSRRSAGAAWAPKWPRPRRPRPRMPSPCAPPGRSASGVDRQARNERHQNATPPPLIPALTVVGQAQAAIPKCGSARLPAG